MDPLKLLRVATRILMDVVCVLEKKESVFEIGCKCNSVDIAKALQKMLAIMLEDCPLCVVIKDEKIVVVLPENSKQPLEDTSSPLASSQQHLPSQTPLLPFLPGLLQLEQTS